MEEAPCYKLLTLFTLYTLFTLFTLFSLLTLLRPAQIAELPRSKFDPELFPHCAYVEIFVTFATNNNYNVYI